MAIYDPKLEAAFTRAMLEIYTEAQKLKPKYNPNDFLGMVNEHGGKGAADRLLSGATPSSGFGQLLMRGKDALKLSVEYLVLHEPWRQLFDERQLATARRRLIEVECELPPDDLARSVTDEPLAEELPENLTYPEGAVRRIQINAYERSPAARSACLKRHGTACVICGFDFGKSYGPVAAGFIHVHHLKPVSRLENTQVDPETDLRPVCPNCHAVIHLGGECRSVEEVKSLLGGRASGLA